MAQALEIAGAPGRFAFKLQKSNRSYIYIYIYI